MSWREEVCDRCRGYGVVSDYSGGDFNGAAPCDDCGEIGRIFIHEASGTRALWPGGPLRGRVPAPASTGPSGGAS